MNRSNYLLAAVGFFCAACDGREAEQCQSGHLDGGWAIVGEAPPPIDSIKHQLLDQPLIAGNELLRGGFVIDEEIGTGPQVRRWVFESMRRTVYNDCVGPEKVTFTQSFLVVRAEIVEGVVSRCSVQTRMTIGEAPTSVPSLQSSLPGPLDSDPEPCETPKMVRKAH